MQSLLRYSRPDPVYIRTCATVNATSEDAARQLETPQVTAEAEEVASKFVKALELRDPYVQ